jgi:hypothetical protein
MKRFWRNWLAIGSVVVGLAMSATRPAMAQEDEGPTASVRFAIVRDTDGKPVKDAQVVIHPMNRKGKASNQEIELKTDTNGRASVDAIPYGSIEVQVLAPKFQTFGEDYEVKQAQVEITVKLKRPTGQYSIYENHDTKPQ